MKIRNVENFCAGFLFVILGGIGIYIGRGYDFGSLTRMGSGFFPVILSAALILTGLGIAVGAVNSEETTLERISIRPLVLVPAAVITFALMIPRLGLVLTVLVVAAVAGLASPDVDMRSNALLAGALAIFSLAVFRLALGIPIPIW